jgi:hypothetical protein
VEPAEVKAWTEALQGHLSPAEVAQALLVSDDYSERRGR